MADPVLIDDDDVVMVDDLLSKDPVVIVDEDEERINNDKTLSVPSVSTQETIVLDDETPITTGIDTAPRVMNRQAEKSFINNLENNRLIDKIVTRCITMENATGMPRVIYKTLLPLYKDSSNRFKESDAFRALLRKTYKLLTKDPDHKFLHVKTLCEELKSGGLRRKVPFVTLATNMKNKHTQSDNIELPSNSKGINQNRNKNVEIRAIPKISRRNYTAPKRFGGRAKKRKVNPRDSVEIRSVAQTEKTEIIDLDDSDTESDDLGGSKNADGQNDVIIVEETEPSAQRNNNLNKLPQETLESNKVLQVTLEEDSNKENNVIQDTSEKDSSNQNRMIQETLEPNPCKNNKATQSTLEKDSNEQTKFGKVYKRKAKRIQATIEIDSNTQNEIIQETLAKDSNRQNKVIPQTLVTDSNEQNKLMQAIETDSNTQNKRTQAILEKDANIQNKVQQNTLEENEKNGILGDNAMDYDLLIPKNRLEVLSENRIKVMSETKPPAKPLAKPEDRAEPGGGAKLRGGAEPVGGAKQGKGAEPAGRAKQGRGAEPVGGAKQGRGAKPVGGAKQGRGAEPGGGAQLEGSAGAGAFLQEKCINDEIARLEERIAYCKKWIDKLEETEVTIETSGSAYYACARFKEDLVACYKRICRLTGNSHEIVKRREIRLQVTKGHPPGPAKRLEDFLNRTIDRTGAVAFPDFSDVLKCVLEAKVADNIAWNNHQTMQEAVALFRQCGQALRKRRQKREYKDLLGLIRNKEETDDPAEKDPLLLAKLEQNKRIAKAKEEQILDSYVAMEQNKRPQYTAEFDSDKDSSDLECESEQTITETPTTPCSTSNANLFYLLPNNLNVSPTMTSNNNSNVGLSSNTNNVFVSHLVVSPTPIASPGTQNPLLLTYLLNAPTHPHFVKDMITNENQSAIRESENQSTIRESGNQSSIREILIMDDDISNKQIDLDVVPANTRVSTPDSVSECETTDISDIEEKVNPETELTITETTVGFSTATSDKESEMISINRNNIENTVNNRPCNVSDINNTVSSSTDVVEKNCDSSINPEGVLVKTEPLDIQNMLDELGDGFVCQVFDIEDPFLVIEISSDESTDDEEL